MAPAASSKLKYVQIYQQLKDEILADRYRQSQKLESEWELMTRFDVSRTTIRKALDLLRQDGLIRSTRGHGTDVVHAPMPRVSDVGIRCTEVSNVVFYFPETPASITSSEILADVIPAYEDVAQALEVEPGTKIYRMRWLHFTDGIPYMYLTNFLRMDLVPGLPEHIEGMVSLYPLLDQVYGLKFLGATESVDALTADFITARLLDVPAGTPLVHLRRIARCNAGPMEYSLSAIRPDRLRIDFSITRASGEDMRPFLPGEIGK